jgi:predicted ATP-binding protein involved in virulence
MRVKNLNIQNFRGIDNLNLKFSNIEPIVFIGTNGVGKSSLLDCLAILLSRFTTAIHSNSTSGKPFSEDDISNKKKETQNEVEIFFESQDIKWSIAKVRSGRSKDITSNLRELREITESMRHKLSEVGNTQNIPIIVYYPTNRAVLDIPMSMILIRLRLTIKVLALEKLSSEFFLNGLELKKI